MSRGKAKGNQFEREICRRLSRWWSMGKRDDVFWRSTSSGGQATTRAKVGKKTFGQYGDIQATDPWGQPLLDLLTIELKRGYGASTFGDLVDRPEGGAAPIWLSWVVQAEEEKTQAGVSCWWLITKRDRRRAIICMPYRFIHWLEEAGLEFSRFEPMASLKYCRNHSEKTQRLAILPLDDFLCKVRPDFVRRVGQQQLVRKARDGR